MARNDDRDRITSKCIRRGAGCAGTASLLRDITIGAQVAERHPTCGVEHGMSERRNSRKIERNLKPAPLSPEIFSKLPRRAGDGIPIRARVIAAFFEVTLKRSFRFVPGKSNFTETRIARRQKERSDRAVHSTVSSAHDFREVHG